MLRRISLLLLQDKNGRVLMQHRDKDAPTNPDLWGLFGGHIRENEEPKIAAIRELNEELGIQITELNFFKRYDFEYINREVFVYTGRMNIDLEQLKKQQTEGQNIGFFTYEELKNMKVVKYVMEVLYDFLS